MSKNIFLKVSIISISLILAIGLLISSNAKAQWGWGPQYGQGGWGSFNNNRGFGGSGYFGPKSSSKTVRSWAGWNNDGWEKFIEVLQEEYPDLEGINWDEYEDWDEDDWNDLKEALQEVRLEECLDNFIEDVTEKFDAYDNDDWESFNSNFFAFIESLEEEETDIDLLWAGFVATYGCFDDAANDEELIECWKNYEEWDENQWADFRGIYSEYLDYEWTEFNEELQERLEEYYDDLADWEDWRDWTDEEWETYLDKYSDYRTSSSSGGYGFNSPSGGFGFGGYSGFGFGCPSGYSYGSPGCFGFGSSSGYGFGGPGGYGFGFPGGYGYGGSNGNGYGFGNLGKYVYSNPGGYNFGFPGGYGFGGQGGYGFGFPGGYGNYSGPWGSNSWW